MTEATAPSVTLQDVAEAATEFQRILNACPVELEVDIRSMNYSVTSKSRTVFEIMIRTHDRVFP